MKAKRIPLISEVLKKTPRPCASPSGGFVQGLHGLIEAGARHVCLEGHSADDLGDCDDDLWPRDCD